jgi:TRAP-type C4-dicarboxylate transport system substrate-binding protein
MKKAISLLLTLSLVLSLAGLTACSSSSSGSSSSSSSTSAESESAESASTESESAESEAAEAEDTSDVEYDTLELTTATSYNETDFSGALIKWFGDYLEEKSGGKITLKCYYGGSFCTDAEIYDYVMSGDMNLSFVQPVYAMTYFPYAFGVASYISDENAVDTANSLIYDNEETAALIEEQGAANNLHLLGHTSAGSSIFVSKNEIVSFEDASQYTIGSPINLEIYADYGFGTVAVEPADMYDSLSRGVCDLVAFSAPNVATQKLYEVAANIGDPRAYFSNQIICLNNDVWNSLNEDTQNLLIEAALAVGDYSVEYVHELEDELYETVLDYGGSYNLWTEEEGLDFNYRSMSSNADLIRGFAENIGASEGMEVIIAAWAEGLQQEPF